MADSRPLSSCFICGGKIVSSKEKPGNGKVDQERLNTLLKCLNDLLIVASGSRKEGSSFYKKRRRGRNAGFVLPEEEKSNCCCVSCYGILNGIEITHRCILSSQKQLKGFLERVRKLVVKSGTAEKEVPSWGPKCLEIRTRLLGSKGQGCQTKIKKKTNVDVKKEPETEDGAEEDSQDNPEIKSNQDDVEVALSDEDDFTTQETDPRRVENCEIPDADSAPLAKKQKMEAEMESDAESDTGDDEGNLESESDAVSYPENEGNPEPAEDSTQVRRRPRRTGMGKHYYFRPLIIAKPDVFLYRGSHYIQKTPTHLQCLAHECSFQTEFDYYPSFQLIKTHIQDTHFGKSALFCLLCKNNPFFAYKDELRSHNKTFHQELSDYKTRAICECCLKSVAQVNLKEHMFLHKNQEETDIALKLRKQSFPEFPNLPKSTLKTSPSTLENSGSSSTKFHALVIAQEDLYLYRWRTYIQKTPTHLKCLSYQCSFQTEFDYYSSFQVIKKHIEDVHRTRYQLKKMPVPCCLCEKSPLFRSYDLLVDHNRVCHQLESHSKKSRAVCECCLKDMNIRCVRDHMYFHKNDTEKATALASGRGPKMHFYMKEYHKNAEKKYKCDFPNCTMTFQGPKKLECHKQIHLPKEQRTDQTLCPECGIYVFSRNFSYHRETTHCPETMTNCVTCPICSKKFHSKPKGLYDAHLQGHHGERPFLCEDCGASFIKAGNLSAHVKNVHGPTGRLQCEICEEVFTEKGSLEGHRESVHGLKAKERRQRRKMGTRKEKEKKKQEFGPEQKFPCEFCKMVYKNKRDLKLHVRRCHNNLKAR